jgi:hypothetical protein
MFSSGECQRKLFDLSTAGGGVDALILLCFEIKLGGQEVQRRFTKTEIEFC